MQYKGHIIQFAMQKYFTEEHGAQPIVIVKRKIKCTVYIVHTQLMVCSAVLYRNYKSEECESETSLKTNCNAQNQKSEKMGQRERARAGRAKNAVETWELFTVSVTG